jgi:hypothetical protein
MKQLERRLIKLEARAAASAKAESKSKQDSFFDRFYPYLTDLEKRNLCVCWGNWERISR